MPLILPKSVMLMVPRAASTWARQAIRNSGLSYKEFGPKHATALPPNAPAFKFCFVREPAAWLKSRWVLGPWEDMLTQFWDVDFAKFRAAVSDDMVRMYFGQYTAGCQFVGKAETVADDLVSALRQAGEDFDEVSLRATPRINESPKDGGVIPEVYWNMRRDRLNQLDAGNMSRLPVELIPKLTPAALAKLPPETLAEMVAKNAVAALQAAGAATQGTQLGG